MFIQLHSQTRWIGIIYNERDWRIKINIEKNHKSYGSRLFFKKLGIQNITEINYLDDIQIDMEWNSDNSMRGKIN